MSTLIPWAAICAVLFLGGAARAAVAPFTIIQVSDTHISAVASAHDTNLKNAVTEINAIRPLPAVLFHTGDITELGQDVEFQRYLNDVKDLRVAAKYSPGNHETRWADRSINRFAEYFGDPNGSFLLNGVRFIRFNAAIWLEHHGAVSGDTRRWIVSELAKDPPGTPAVLMCHQPPMYPDNVFMTGDVELWKAIVPYNVRLFLNGHGHIFKSWTVNGVLCHMTKGMMNDAGGYSIYEVGTTDIKVYEKLVGSARKLVATVPLTPSGITVDIADLGSSDGTASYEAAVTSAGPAVSRVECQVDDHDHPSGNLWTVATKAGDGKYHVSVPLAGLTQGRHTFAVRAVDATGGVWMSSVPLTVAGPIAASSFDADTALQAPAAVDDTMAYAGGWDGKLYAVNRATMQPAWSFATAGPIVGEAAFDAARLYVGSTDQSIYALDKSDGARIWKFPTGGPIQGHLLAADGAVFAASGDHNLYALDGATGALRWSYTMDLHAQARPAYGDGAVYLGAWDRAFYALDARTGALRWKKTIGSILNFSPAVTSPVFVDGRVILTAAQPSGSPNIFCLDATTGATLWTQRIADGASPYGSPTTDGRRVYLAALDGSLWALNATDGTVLWTARMPDIIYDGSPVVVGNNQVVCNSLYGGVQGRNAANGTRLWDYKTGAGLQFAWPTLADGVAYQTSFDGTLTAITLPE
jgi:outer membrane protein assembly factor BamB